MTFEDTLQAVLDAQQQTVELLTQLLERLGTNGERVSSVEVKTSTRGTDVAVKAYSGSDVEAAGNAAVAEYRRVISELNERGVAAMAAEAAR